MDPPSSTLPPASLRGKNRNRESRLVPRQDADDLWSLAAAGALDEFITSSFRLTAAVDLHAEVLPREPETSHSRSSVLEGLSPHPLPPFQKQACPFSIAARTGGRSTPPSLGPTSPPVTRPSHPKTGGKDAQTQMSPPSIANRATQTSRASLLECKLHSRECELARLRALFAQLAKLYVDALSKEEGA